MAFRVIAVSISVSPLRIDETATAMLMTSAPSRLPATSNEVRVRVEFSKKQLISVRPRKVGGLLVALPAQLDIGVGAVEHMLDILRLSPSMPSRCRCPKRYGCMRPGLYRAGRKSEAHSAAGRPC